MRVSNALSLWRTARCSWKIPGIKNRECGYVYNVQGKVQREGLITMQEQKDPQSVLEKLIAEDLNKVDVKVKKLQYKMDFGTTEIVIKLGFN